ncbi:hypothetical protein C0991_000829, partial [Blastosporella zonata]
VGHGGGGITDTGVNHGLTNVEKLDLQIEDQKGRDRGRTLNEEDGDEIKEGGKEGEGEVAGELRKMGLAFLISNGRG